jgi:polyisoprenoid-binding protein YceI
MRLAALSLLLAAVPLAAQMPGAPQASRVTAGTYQVDPNHTQVTWSVNHMGFSMLQGQIGASGGSITVDPARPQATKLEVTFDVAKLTAPSERFTAHLKSPDFFDAANNPTATFTSTAVRVQGSRATITGNLTIKGVTKPVTLQAEFIGAGPNPQSKKTNFGFRATGQVNRSDFGLGMAVPVVSDRVDLVINAAFTAA